MKIFETAIVLPNNRFNKDLKDSLTGNWKQWLTLFFLIVVTLCYVIEAILEVSDNTLENTSITMGDYGKSLKMNHTEVISDSVVHHKERQQLLLQIEEKLVGYLYQIPDYSYIKVLEPYLEYAPKILEQIPSVVPLEKGDYWLSSPFGIRQHPISTGNKKHFGIDFAAAQDKYVYATAKGTVLKVLYSKNGYGNHIILQHRFGFQTLYGHLNKVLVKEGQTILQHELVGTVGSTGASTGYHLHYEIIKNTKKIDPMPSLKLKYGIYQHMMDK